MHSEARNDNTAVLYLRDQDDADTNTQNTTTSAKDDNSPTPRIGKGGKGINELTHQLYDEHEKFSKENKGRFTTPVDTRVAPKPTGARSHRPMPDNKRL